MVSYTIIVANSNKPNTSQKTFQKKLDHVKITRASVFTESMNEMTPRHW